MVREAVAAGGNISLDRRRPQMMYRGGNFSLQRAAVFKLGSSVDWLNATANDKLTIAQMVGYRHLLDVPGYGGTTWGALAWKFASGSLVFRISSAYEDWWHRMLVPWSHFIPVDFGGGEGEPVVTYDLEAKHQWALSHPAKSAEIAQRGAQLAKAATTPRAQMHCAVAIMASLRHSG